MNENILIVDDEKEIADLIEVYLKNDGYTVHKFYNGMDALNCIESEKIDLAILDVMLPDIDGFRICQKIRDKYFYPIIMLTAKVEDSDKIMGLTIGADDYITKPFNPLEVVARVKTQLRRYVRYNNATNVEEKDALIIEYDVKGLIINKHSSPNDRTRLQLDLRPVLSLKSKVVSLRKIKEGDSVGYNRSFVADRDSLIAVLPIGYADGYPRNLSCGKSYVLINGHQAPIVGRICMDQLLVNVTDIPDVKVGITATLIGKDGDEEISAAMVADNSESITNELLSRIGKRVKIAIVAKELQ